MNPAGCVALYLSSSLIRRLLASSSPCVFLYANYPLLTFPAPALSCPLAGLQVTKALPESSMLVAICRKGRKKWNANESMRFASLLNGPVRTLAPRRDKVSVPAVVQAAGAYRFLILLWSFGERDM